MTHRVGERWRSALAILAFAVGLRCWIWGNPVVHVDEQFYLLVGDRLLHGAVPYLDLWDRKPVGLFLLYALFALVPGWGVIVSQVAATGFAAATGWVIARIARRCGTGPLPAVAAGCAYVTYIGILGGESGQSPVFYNLPVAVGALLTVRLPALAARGDTGAIVRSGLAACLLAGLAIQLKYTAVFEGAFFGLAHIVYLRRAGATRRATVAAGLGWAAVGLLPTLLAIAGFALLGEAALRAYWFANFESILLRPGPRSGVLITRLGKIAGQLSPLIIAAALVGPLRRGVLREPRLLLIGWLIAAVIGFMAIGTFFDHYALPLVAPLAVCAGLGFARYRPLIPAVLAIGIAAVGYERWTHRGDTPGAYAVAEAVARNSAGRGCPYVALGDTITYYLARSCLPTRYPFPQHLTDRAERGAIGINQAAEIRRIFATRPPVVVAVDRARDVWMRRSKAALRDGLTRYRPVLAVKRYHYRTIVYLRRDLPVRRGAPAPR